MASVSFQSLDYVYPDGTQGLKDINLDISDGEFVALVGPSGSGKTTLLRALAGFLQPTAGSINIGGGPVASASLMVPPEERSLGMVFQQHAIWPHWDVAQNIAYPLSRRGIKAAERTRRVADVLELVGLPGAGKRNPGTLSGGQRQRVALARAIVSQPRVLLLDEALSALDEPLRDALRLELQSLTRSVGLTVVHVTHDREEALALADRVVVLEHGRIQQVGTPPELVAFPANPGIAQFLSDANVILGELNDHTFLVHNQPCTIDRESLEVRDEAPGPGQLAVMPEDIDLIPDASGAATVRSSLYGRSGNDVIVDWQGMTLRCKVRGRRPLVGERTNVVIRRGLFYRVPTRPTLAVSAA
ncbi:ABC transporter ATP-binding protein [Paenarthrobacter sp. NCHU4564]|uniref:ABC transporter ATP-binding protein n=1 Tax=Paenarthrobacter sp. NCHU4564 TaxID=3451353 RepID=UPI003F970372